MKSLPFGSLVFLLIDLSLLLLGLSNIPPVFSRATIPFQADLVDGRVVVLRIIDQSASGSLRVGDRVIRWKDQAVEAPEVLEFFSDLSGISDRVSIEYERENVRSRASIFLISYYQSPRFVLTMVFVGVITWAIGILVLIHRRNDTAAGILHWSLILLATTVLLTQGALRADEVLTLIRRCLLHVTYTLLAAVFLLFTTVFPKSKLGTLPKKAILILSPAIFLAMVQIWFFLQAVQTYSAEVFGFFQRSFDAFHIAFFLYGGISLANFIHSYRVSETIEEKKKLQWILWGFVIGVAPFLLFVVLPQFFFPASLIPEEFTIIFVICIPLSFAISVLKYRLFDIEIIINRSIAYMILSFIVGVVYVFSVLLMTSLIGGQRVFEEYLLLIGVSLAIAFVFNPLRNHVQRFVDETLFPARGKFRKLTKELSAEFHDSFSSDQLLSRVVTGLERLIPATTVAVYTYQPPTMSLQSIKGVPLKESFHLSKDNASMITRPKIYAVPGAVNFAREDVDGSFEAMLVRLGISMCLPLVSETKELLGVVAIGSHPEKGRFNEEEVDLLATVAHQAEDVLERLIFQERMIIERDQKRRAEEMSRMKSYLVSSVSHELRTPLTSIRMFAETLGSTAGKSKKLRKEYLEIIEGESLRLAHLIDNILDSAKIERGVQEYKFERMNLSQVIRRALQATAYLVKSTGTKLRVRVPKKLPSLLADGDALEEALINLITNAVKYSPERREVSVSVTNKRNSVCVEVADLGAGISADDLPRIFDPFYRAHQDGARVHGAGLGLSLVKHIVEAHRGTVQVESTLGQGSSFRIHLPFTKKKP